MEESRMNLLDCCVLDNKNTFTGQVVTYDHRVWRTGLPVRSAVLKPHAGRLVVGWVTTSESRLLYVFVHPFFFVWLGNWTPAAPPPEFTCTTLKSPDNSYVFFLFLFLSLSFSLPFRH